MKKKLSLVLGFFLILQSFAAVVWAAEGEGNLQLKQVLVLSRHNIRAPLSGPDSILAEITPHTWHAWSADTGELTLLGGGMETLMGQYFRQWLEGEQLIPKNYEPKYGAVRFYANSVQRTIATAQYFSSGMLPIANVTVERHNALNEGDPVFWFDSFEISDYGRRKMESEAEALGGAERIGRYAIEDTTLVEQVLDFRESEYAGKHGVASFLEEGTPVVLENLSEVRGAVRPAMKAADALILQSYEESNNVRAAFGENLTEEQWSQIGRLKNLGLHTLLCLPSISKVLAHPLLEVMEKELMTEGRIFTFLCGHDSNLVTVLAALGTEPYVLPGTVEPDTPIGVKLVIEKWIDSEGEEYADLKLVYQGTEQIRNREMLTLENPPVIVPLHLKGLDENEAGMCRFRDLRQRFSDAIHAYDELTK